MHATHVEHVRCRMHARDPCTACDVSHARTPPVHGTRGVACMHATRALHARFCMHARDPCTACEVSHARTRPVYSM